MNKIGVFAASTLLFSALFFQAQPANALSIRGIADNILYGGGGANPYAYGYPPGYGYGYGFNGPNGQVNPYNPHFGQQQPRSIGREIKRAITNRMVRSLVRSIF